MEIKSIFSGNFWDFPILNGFAKKNYIYFFLVDHSITSDIWVGEWRSCEVWRYFERFVWFSPIGFSYKNKS